MSSAPSNPAPRPVFATTRWTQVLRARGKTPEARQALGDLCAAYWTPVFRFFRHSGVLEDEARDLAQEFFARLLAKQGLDTVRPGRGKFRSFLLGAAKHFLADHRDHQRRLKRGGGQTFESLDVRPASHPADTSHGASLGDQIADPASAPQDAFFDRQWALALMDRALAFIETEFVQAGKREQFDALKPWLAGEAESLSQSEAAQRLGFSEGAIKVAIHRLRRRFRERVRAEIEHTLADPSQRHVDEELRYLIEVLSDRSLK